ncbi:MAG TPA: hypothetical protein VH253_14145 [Phycisphaerae bacterium]|nr:hypothetical protein [Phycisphaerae bacterium]
MRIKMFTVFHRALDERLSFPAIEADDLQTFFTHYGVNAKWPRKEIRRLSGALEVAGETSPPDVLLEYRLPVYSPDLQARGFMETSCYVHLLKNNLHLPYDYLGVCQYDMRWTAPAVKILRELAAASTHPPTAWGIICGPIMNAQGYLHPLTFAHIRNWSFMLESYNRFFGTRWEPRMLVGKPFTLFQTYLLPRDEFAALAAWLDTFCRDVYPWAAEPPYETHWGSLSGYSERAESLFIAARIAEGRLRVAHLPVEHDPDIPKKLQVSKDHYGT